ncbi:hypothetical protein QBC35DRAFT_474913 [Podospora australis]|uniref:Hsp70 family chaperone n=1 Tax=Podospora australis TaxID=1536484 RepID=A0AAN7AH29_9PEZI|nr:hypothetical protein QBC35DRAFT_474913 [Podospora australis]
MNTKDTYARADICVAIDYGTTYTGVAWLMPKQEFAPIQVISDWPGGGDTVERKVPSVLAKHLDDRGIRKWGFLCEDDMNEADKWRYLKIFLDPLQYKVSRQEGISWAPQSLAQVHSLVSEYLHQVYCHIKRSITRSIGRAEDDGWDDLAIEFVFSVPTTWAGQGILDDFQTIIRNAGFGVPDRHEAVLGLTEAEAAAVSSMRHVGSAISFDNQDVFLSIDAGGGTTDLAFVKVISATPPVMEQVQAVKGTGIGSMMIDKSFRQLIVNRLQQFPDVTRQLPIDLPLRLSQSPYYRTQKHKFGEPTWERDVYKVGVMGIRHDFQHEGLGLEDGHIKIRKEELEHIFDLQLTKILETLEEGLDKFEQDGFTSVKYVVLSGGLGSSSYIFRKIKEHISVSSRRSLNGTRVQMCAEPQLVVIKGLLLEQMNSILRTRIARASYGVVTSPKYSKLRHFGQKVSVDPFDGKRYVSDQIQWLVKRGDKIAAGQLLSVQIERRAGEHEPLRWTETIVWSENGADWLPNNMTEPGAVRLYEIGADLTDVDTRHLTQKKKRRRWLFGEIKSRHYICHYDVHLVVGASGDLRFAVTHNGQSLPNSAAPVRVQIEAEWDTAQQPAEAAPQPPTTARNPSLGSWESSNVTLIRTFPVMSNSSLVGAQAHANH